jgi:hypothetical protein
LDTCSPCANNLSQRLILTQSIITPFRKPRRRTYVSVQLMTHKEWNRCPQCVTETSWLCSMASRQMAHSKFMTAQRNRQDRNWIATRSFSQHTYDGKKNITWVTTAMKEEVDDQSVIVLRCVTKLKLFLQRGSSSHLCCESCMRQKCTMTVSSLFSKLEKLDKLRSSLSSREQRHCFHSTYMMKIEKKNHVDREWSERCSQ